MYKESIFVEYPVSLFRYTKDMFTQKPSPY
jgi:hypothetical protein